MKRAGGDRNRRLYHEGGRSVPIVKARGTPEHNRPKPRVRDGTVTPHRRLSKAFLRSGTIENRGPRRRYYLRSRTMVKRAIRIAYRCARLDRPTTPRQANLLTAAVTGRMKIPSASRTIRSSRARNPCGPRSLPLSVIESTGGHTDGISRRAFVRLIALVRSIALVQSLKTTSLFRHHVRHVGTLADARVKSFFDH